MISSSILNTVKRLSEKYEIDCSVGNAIDFITGVDVDLKKFAKVFPWGKIKKEDDVDDNFIEFFKENLDWYTISRVGNLSEAFIEKYKDNLNWSMLSQHQVLSENFMEKYKDKLDWSKIVVGQVLTEDFILKHKSRFPSTHALFIFQKLSGSFKDRYFRN